MRDPWILTSQAAARAAGRCTADIIRYRADLADLAPLEAHAGETFAGAAMRVSLAAAELKRQVWRQVARSPALALLPPVAVALAVAAYRRPEPAGGEEEE